MKFRTEITPTPLRSPIRREEQLLAVGSCFAEQIAGRLAATKFRITTNPAGILFNPASIAQSIERWSQRKPFDREEFRQSATEEKRWFHYELHGQFSSEELAPLHQAANQALETAHRALQEADRLLLTFGTAWVYEVRETGRIAANCHRQPQSLFTRRRLRVEEIVECWSRLLEGPLHDKRILMTLSPIRHLADGAEENSLGKATLRLAIAELQTRYPQIDYFPAYELLMDDLRDYRFYGEDLVHPSPQAVAYVWEKFAETALDPEAFAFQQHIEELRRALSHRPLHPESESYKTFCRNTLRKISALEQEFSIDLSEEKAFFKEKID